jgi:hypothetical protein
MPNVVVIATTHSRKMMLVHEGGGSSSLPLPSRPQQQQQVQFFGSNQTMLMSMPPRWLSRDQRMASRGGGRRGRKKNQCHRHRQPRINPSCQWQRRTPRLPPRTPNTGPIFAFTIFSLAIEWQGLEKQPLLVVLSSYVHFYVSVLHLILIDFVLES